MSRLSASENNLLQRIDAKEELRPLFFRKVKGVKWFDALVARKYFNPQAMPRPKPANEPGYIIFPHWVAIEYLVNTAPELALPENREYAPRFAELLVDITNHAKIKKIGNYRTWWHFAQIISQIPPEFLTLAHVDTVNYWLDDKYESGLVAEELGEKWLPKLLSDGSPHALVLANRLLGLLFKAVFIKSKFADKERKEAKLRFNNYHAQRIVEKVAKAAGEKLGKEGVLVFDHQLQRILQKLKNDSWSSVWHPSIEESDQNKNREDAENTLIVAYRDALSAYMTATPVEAHDYVKAMLENKYKTIQRLAIHTIDNHFNHFSDVVPNLVKNKYLHSNYRHEMWHFLNRHYQHFPKDQKKKLLGLISKIKNLDEKGNLEEGSTAYSKSIWLSAIRNHGNEEERLYSLNVAVARTEPEHPDFASYMSFGWVADTSPLPVEDLKSRSIEELIQTLNNYKDPGRFNGPGIRGLAKAFKQVVKSEPLKFSSRIESFLNLDLAFVHELLQAYSELWSEKAQLPWDELWSSLISFSESLIKQDHFWTTESAQERASFVANRQWIVSDISQLIEAGTKSDEHAFNEKYLRKAEEIILLLLEHQEGAEFDYKSDAVSVAINSPRGHCLEALINLALRTCRLSDKTKKNHHKAWLRFRPIFDKELKLPETETPQYEFTTLVTNYLPNFIYMSEEWVLENLSNMFKQDNYLKWLCAVQGYSYVNIVYPKVYKHLKDEGDLLRILDDENIKDRIEDKAVQNIVIGYLEGYESLSNQSSLIEILVARKDYDELSQLIWFMWTMRKNDDEGLTSAIFELWPQILKDVDFNETEGRKIASLLCHWSAFIEVLDAEKLELLLTIAPYADEAYHSSELLESMARLSQDQPFEIYTIWMKLLERSAPDFPEEALRQILNNLLRQGHEGVRKAKEIISKYISYGNDRPAIWLKSIQQN